jgi:predicted RNA-binding Zn-ribbon protein involved in translation (DUF1610 family)
MQIMQSNPAQPAANPEPCPECGGAGWVWVVRESHFDPFLGIEAEEVRGTCPECGPVPANNDQESLADEAAIPADLSDEDLPF